MKKYLCEKKKERKNEKMKASQKSEGTKWQVQVCNRGVCVCVCVGMHVCVCVCVCARVRACVCVARRQTSTCCTDCLGTAFFFSLSFSRCSCALDLPVMMLLENPSTFTPKPTSGPGHTHTQVKSYNSLPGAASFSRPLPPMKQHFQCKLLV